MTRHRLKGAALFLLALAVADVTLAQAFKLLGNTEQAARKVENERKFRIPSPVFHHTFVASFAGESSWGPAYYPFLTNSLGFRDKSPRQINLAPKGRRLLLIGDSFTEGVGLAIEETFAGLMADRLAPSEIDVLNAGVTSYSPSIYYAKIKHLIETVGLKFDRVVVFIDMSDMEDEAAYYRLRDDRVVGIRKAPDALPPLTRIKAFLKSNSLIFRAVDLVHDWQRTGAGLRRARWTIDDGLYTEYGAEGLRRAGHNMDRLYTLLTAQRIGMAVVVYPWPDQILEGDLDSRQVRFWRDWSRAHRIPFVNLFPRFMTGDDALGNVRRYFIRGDFHWNAAGHRLVADRVLESLKDWLQGPKSGP